jgi:hypothetical protein
MTKQDAQLKALQNAKDKLFQIDLIKRCELLDLSLSDDKKTVYIRLFAQDTELNLENLDLYIQGTEDKVKLGDHILVLHYLLHEKPIIPSGEMITFRNLSGGQFYFGPFLSRTVNPLLGRVGEDLDLLKKNLDRFDWEEQELKDFSAKVHGIGNLYITIVYHIGDDEFPPAIDILFDNCIKDVLVAEDAAVLASRICIGLL